MKGILLLLFSLALFMRVVVVVVVLRLVKSEAVVLCVSRHETHESLPLLTRSHDVSSFYALRFPVDEFRVHVHLMRYSNKNSSSIDEERLSFCRQCSMMMIDTRRAILSKNPTSPKTRVLDEM